GESGRHITKCRILVGPPSFRQEIQTAFETLFKYPRVIARHRMGPSAEARERFLKHCSGQGLAGATLLRHARQLLAIAERIDITIGETIGLPAIETAADCWDREQHDRHRAQAVGWS